MKKTILKWRLSELPTGSEVAELVSEGVITKEEAREILFNTENNDSKKVEALEEEIKFLRSLVDTLASKHNGWTTIVHEYKRWIPSYPYWYGTYGSVMSTLGNTQTYTSGANSTFTSGTIGGAQNINMAQLSGKSNTGLSSLNK